MECLNEDTLYEEKIDSIYTFGDILIYHYIPDIMIQSIIQNLEDAVYSKNFDFTILSNSLYRIYSLSERNCFLNRFREENSHFSVREYLKSTFEGYQDNTFADYDDFIEETDSKSLAELKIELEKERINSIRNFVLNSSKPVTRLELSDRFGTSVFPIMQNKILLMGDIVNLRGSYTALKNIPITSNDILKLHEIVQEHLSSNEAICHFNQLYIDYSINLGDICRNSYIKDGASLYGLLFCLFNSEFIFDYPFIAARGVNILPATERIQRFIVDEKVYKIDLISEYIRKNNLSIGNILKFLDSLNDKFLIKNENELIPISKVDITYADFLLIEELIQMELEENKKPLAIRELKCIVKFPKIRVNWDEWLIYSILKKWDSDIYLVTTNAQMRLSIPVVSIYGNIKKSDLQNIANKFSTSSTSKVEKYGADIDGEDWEDLIIAEELSLDDINFDLGLDLEEI